MMKGTKITSSKWGGFFINRYNQLVRKVNSKTALDIVENGIAGAGIINDKNKKK